jgi:hypothetical protein
LRYKETREEIERRHVKIEKGREEKERGQGRDIKRAGKR